MISFSVVIYGGGNKLFELAKASVQPDGATPTGESRTKSGIATSVSSKRDFIVCKIQIIMSTCVGSTKLLNHFLQQTNHNHIKVQKRSQKDRNS